MNRYITKVSTLSAAILLTLSIAHAQPITISNFSFEANGNIQEAAPTGWTGFNVGGGGSLGNGWDWGASIASGGDFTAAADGSAYLWVNRWTGNGTQVAGVYQDVGTLLADTTYTLTVAIGQRAGTGPNGTWSPGIISLLNGTDNTGTVEATGGGLPSTPNTWQDFTASFTTGATVSGDLTIDLSALDAPSIQADFDNVRLNASPVPEPSTCALLGGGLISLMAFCRRMSA